MVEKRRMERRARLFQFQSGAIKCSALVDSPAGIVTFQFQSGAIKCLGKMNNFTTEEGFNSNLVRLNALLRHIFAQDLVCFNSNLVRLNGK